MAGGVLKLHPKIVVENGAMDATKKYRGKIGSVIMNYVKDMEEDLKNARPDRVFITHSGCDRATVDAVRNYLDGLGIFHEILETRAGGVISKPLRTGNPRGTVYCTVTLPFQRMIHFSIKVLPAHPIPFQNHIAVRTLLLRDGDRAWIQIEIVLPEAFPCRDMGVTMQQDISLLQRRRCLCVVVMPVSGIDQPVSHRVTQ